MDVAPGEVIHMDENGAVKFPAKYLPEILERVKKIAARDLARQEHIRVSSTAAEIADCMKGIYK